MKGWLVLIVAASFAAALPVFGEVTGGKITGNDVLDRCQTAVRFADNDGAPVGEHLDAGWCFGWIAGTLELTKLHNEWTTFIKQKPTLLQFCLPRPIPVIQAVRVVVKYLKEHPEQLHEDAMGLTMAALNNSFPCK